MRIGQVAQASGVSVRAIRHYEQLGLLAATRTDSQYRVFQPEDIDRVKLIQLFLSVGFKLEEINRWAPCFQEGRSDRDTSPQEMHAFYMRKIANVDMQLAALKIVRDKLATEARRIEEQARDLHLHPDR